MDRIPLVVYIVIFTGMIVWLLPFFLNGWSRRPPANRDPRWRWGILLEVAAYLVLVLPAQYVGIAAVPTWRIALSIFFFMLASLLSWTAPRALGKFLRFEAALDADHQLVRNGPYAIVRHPIYASMLCIFLGMAAMVATPLTFALALMLFIAGTEVRVHIEDKLLANHFGGEFQSYQHSTPAYIPFLR